MIQNYRFEARWVNLEMLNPNNDLRYQAAAKGAAVIARGEGIHIGKNEPTSAQQWRKEKVGQVFRLSPSRDGLFDTVGCFSKAGPSCL